MLPKFYASPQQKRSIAISLQWAKKEMGCKVISLWNNKYRSHNCWNQLDSINTTGTKFLMINPCIRCSATALYFSQSKYNGTELATYEAKHRYFPIPGRFSESMELFPLQTSRRGEITPFPHSTSLSDCCFQFKTKQSEHSKRGPSRMVVNSGPKRQ